MSVSTPTFGLNPPVVRRINDRIGSIVKIDAISLILFSVAIFTSATLLFVVQPMVGKILLPKLGGAPAVWNTCMVFFQAILLAGYLSAHLITKYLSLRTQVMVFATALLLAMASLPLSVGPQWVDSLLSGTDPVIWLLTVLLFRVAPVFFVLSVTSPLLQKWFAKSGHPQAHDPYFLYAASNVGSILALLSYPLLIEVNMGVTEQTTTWMFGFGFFILLATACGIASWYGNRRETGHQMESTQSNTPQSQRVCHTLTWPRRARWILLSFIPSSLMLGVTTYISTDVSSIPLIWVVPLAMYLLTFVFAFSNRQVMSAYWMGRIASLLILSITVTMVTGANDPPIIIIPMHLLMFFTVAMFCHQRLAADRPDADHLTDFYLWLSVGGVLGGLFNALIAPSLFVTIIEYPLVMIVASYMRETRISDDDQQASSTWMRSLAFAFGIFVATVILKLFVERFMPALPESIQALMPISISQVQTLVIFGIPAALVFHQMENRTRFTAGLFAIFCVSVWDKQCDTDTLERGRNFYGTIATADESLAAGDVRKMFHGNTVHGWQWRDEDRRREPLAYYGPSSGVNKLIVNRAAEKPNLNIGAIGLGAGTLAAVVRPSDSITFYEINPQVLDHAERHFTYLSDARERGADAEVRLGDARLVLEAETRSEQPGNYDILVVDAFSSDSIPAHLITDECMKIYLDHLRPDGVIAFHITNRYLDLEPVLAILSEENGLAARSYHFRDVRDDGSIDQRTGETMSSWVLIARDEASLDGLREVPHLKPMRQNDQFRLWTDDYSNVISAFNTRL